MLDGKEKAFGKALRFLWLGGRLRISVELLLVGVLWLLEVILDCCSELCCGRLGGCLGLVRTGAVRLRVRCGV